MLKPGDIFGRYLIEASIGQGGMGCVYRAFDERLGRRVALKVLSDGASGVDSDERLLREARAVAALDHPNVVAIFDVGEHEGASYIVMELVSGHTLRSVIPALEVPLRTRITWLTDVARALAAAHRRGLVHRDIKPENVMVREDGAVKVLDFGIARRTGRKVDPTAATQTSSNDTPALPTLTIEGVRLGTPVYMAPEQIRGQALDGRADQFAWGVLACELLTGRVPWRGAKDVFAVVASILTDEVDVALLDAASVPREVRDVILRVLAKQPADRFVVMDDVVSALEAADKGTVVSAPSAPERPAPAPVKERARAAEKKPRVRPHRPDHSAARLEEHREDFLGHVLRICKIREESRGRRVAVDRKTAPPPFHAFAEVCTVEPLGQSLIFAVAGVSGAVTPDQVELFRAEVHTRYQRHGAGTFSQLVYDGARPPETMVRDARRKGIWLTSLAEYQGLIDFQPYMEQLIPRLERDPIYPPKLYVPQRATLSVVGGAKHQVTNALDEVDDLLASPAARFVLILGDFGTGKTFLLHELARRLGARGGPPYPVLIEMRSLEKAHSLEALVANHLAIAGMERIDLPGFRYMLGQGLIALLFDGFDELALRVRYERAADHFDTLIQAAAGNAKVVLTSRTQHFYSDEHVHTSLARQAARIPGYRIAELAPFSPGQIRHFLVNLLESEEKADTWVQLLDDVRDLLHLSENPRLLSFIAEISEQELHEARDRTGEVTAAVLYQKLLDRWFANEHERVNPKGAAVGLATEDRWKAVTALALRLWSKMESSVHVSELPAEIGSAIMDLTTRSIDAGEAAHQVGSGTLLVRDTEGNFSFLHASVLEWLVARAAASEVSRTGMSAVLVGRELSDLMAEFFTALVSRDKAIAWARQVLGASGTEMAKSNALRVLKRLGVEAEERVSLSNQDLRGQDLSRRILREADLTSADLRDATLIETDLSGALLAGARLTRADLSRARLTGANLEGADLSSARLLGADLVGANLAGARLRYAQLPGVRVDEGALIGLDTLGSAPPHPSHAHAITSATSSAVYGVTFSPDGMLLASAHEDGSIRLWDVMTGAERRVLRGHRGHVRSVAWSPDGASLASGAADHTLRLWDVTTGAERRVFQGHSDSVWSVAWSPDGASLASGADDHTVRLWDMATGAERRVLEGHSDYVWSVAWSPDGTMLASGGDDTTIRLWDVATGTARRVFQTHSAYIRSVAFSPDGALLASGAADKTVRLWDVGRGAERRVLQGHSAYVWSVAFSPDSTLLASGAADTTVRLWDTATGATRRVLQGHSDQIRSVAFSFDGATLASGAADKTIRLWDLATGTARRGLQGHSDSVWSVAFSPDGATLASGAADTTVRLWDLVTGTVRRVLRGHSDQIRSVAWSPDGVSLASGAADSTVRLWTVASGAQSHVLQGHSDSVLSVAWSPDGVSLASGAADTTVRLWSIAMGTQRCVLQGHSDSIWGVAWSPDGASLASGADDKTVRIWDGATGAAIRVLQGHTASVWSVAFSPSGAALASGAHDTTVRIWDLATGAERLVLHGHSDSVWSVAWSPDGASLASASWDGTIRLWNVATGACLAVLVPRAEGWAAFTPDGRRYKLGGDIAGFFWYAIGLCRFEPGELDPYVPSLITRVPDDEPLILPP